MTPSRLRLPFPFSSQLLPWTWTLTANRSLFSFLSETSLEHLNLLLQIEMREGHFHSPSAPLAASPHPECQRPAWALPSFCAQRVHSAPWAVMYSVLYHSGAIDNPLKAKTTHRYLWHQCSVTSSTGWWMLKTKTKNTLHTKSNKHGERTVLLNDMLCVTTS